MEMEKEVKILNLDDILPNRFQPRIKFNESAILELAESIKEHGVIQPIVVRKISDKYEIIAGERRYKASVLAGKTTIPAVITTLDDKNSAEIALIENVQRQDLTPIEEAISYKKILDMGYLNQTELAEKLGKTQSTIANKLRLLNLAEEVQEALLDQKISERHARSLLKLPEDKQQNMLDRIINERLTVRKADEEIKKILELEEGSGSSKIIESEKTSSLESSIKAEQIIEESVKKPSVEVLDLELEGKEETKMNKELNIPMEQIIEPVEELSTENNAWSMPSVTPPTQVEPSPIPNINIDPSPININTVSPGFMDVTKIENEAEDIFKPQQDPADMDMLLKSTPKVEPPKESPMAPPTPEITPAGIQSEPSPAGKFFNMFNFSDNSSNTPTPEDLEQKQTNMDFGEPKINNTFMFDFNPLGQKPANENSSVETPNNIFGTPTGESTIMPKVESPINEPTPSIFESPTPTTSFVETNSSNLTNLSSLTPSFEPQKEVESVLETQNVFGTSPTIEPEQNVFTPNIMEEPAPIAKINQSMTEMPTPTSSVVELKTEEPMFEPFNPYALNEEDEFTQGNELDNYRIDHSIAATNVDSPKVAHAAVDIRTIVNTIRECAKTIENYGFKVELDELDFEDKYEVKFIINKN